MIKTYLFLYQRRTDPSLVLLVYWCSNMLGNSTETVQSATQTNQESPSASKTNLLENFIPFQADEYFDVERER
jgi:hypothetical protein